MSMTSVALECIKNPNRDSIWVPELGKYVCPDSEAGKTSLAAAGMSQQEIQQKSDKLPTISPQFKLVFLTAAGGTLLFIILCVVLTFAAGKEPPPLFERVIVSLFDLAKIGFGAVVGLLGGKTMQTEQDAKKISA